MTPAARRLGAALAADARREAFDMLFIPGDFPSATFRSMTRETFSLVSVIHLRIAPRLTERPRRKINLRFIQNRWRSSSPDGADPSVRFCLTKREISGVSRC